MVDHKTLAKYSKPLERQMFKIGSLGPGLVKAGKHAEKSGGDYSLMAATAKLINRIGSYEGSKALSVYRNLDQNIRDTETFLNDWGNYDSNPASQKLVERVSQLHTELSYMKKLVNETPPEVMQEITTMLSTKKCFIATTVYGDEDAHPVQVLRDFRDNVLYENGLGRKIISFYYGGAGRKAADIIEKHIPFVIPAVRKGLDVLVEKYEQK
jgi:hypothetical protein